MCIGACVLRDFIKSCQPVVFQAIFQQFSLTAWRSQVLHSDPVSRKRSGATACARQATARPSFQSLLKLLIGMVWGIFILHHARRACFGVKSLLKSSIIGRLIWYLRINVHIRPRISLRFPLLMSLASEKQKKDRRRWIILSKKMANSLQDQKDYRELLLSKKFEICSFKFSTPKTVMSTHPLCWIK